jgi:preprotein translocase subunit SecD
MPGVSGATAEIQGHDKIVVTLPGARNGRQAASMLTQSALMEFYYLRDVKTDRNPSAKWMMLDTETDPKTGTDVYSFEDSVTHQVIKGDTPASQKLILSKVIGAYEPIKNPNGMRPILTNKDLWPTATADADMNGRAVVHIEFKPTGATVFRDFTRRHIGDIVAVLIDGRILTAPRINEAIPGGQAEISGFKDLAQATDSAQRINLGAMSVHLNVVSVKNL